MDLDNAMMDCLIEHKDNRTKPTQDEFINSVEYHLTEEPSDEEKDIIAEFYHLHFE